MSGVPIKVDDWNEDLPQEHGGCGFVEGDTHPGIIVPEGNSVRG